MQKSPYVTEIKHNCSEPNCITQKLLEEIKSTAYMKKPKNFFYLQGNLFKIKSRNELKRRTKMRTKQ